MHQKAEWTSRKTSQNSSSTVAHVLKSSTEHQNIAPSYRLQNSGLDVMYHSVLCCSTPQSRGSTGGNCPLLQIPKNDLFPNIVVWCCPARGGWEALVCSPILHACGLSDGCRVCACSRSSWLCTCTLNLHDVSLAPLR